MKKLTTLALIAGVSFSTTAQAELIGVYLRNGEEPMSVRTEDGLLFCTRVSDGFEMCNGMVELDDGAWNGDKMKNPDMPRFMSFNGTIRFAEGEMQLQGCLAGKSMCKSMSWPAE